MISHKICSNPASYPHISTFAKQTPWHRNKWALGFGSSLTLILTASLLSPSVYKKLGHHQKTEETVALNISNDFLTRQLKIKETLLAQKELMEALSGNLPSKIKETANALLINLYYINQLLIRHQNPLTPFELGPLQKLHHLMTEHEQAIKKTLQSLLTCKISQEHENNSELFTRMEFMETPNSAIGLSSHSKIMSFLQSIIQKNS